MFIYVHAKIGINIKKEGSKTVFVYMLVMLNLDPMTGGLFYCFFYELIIDPGGLD